MHDWLHEEIMALQIFRSLNSLTVTLDNLPSQGQTFHQWIHFRQKHILLFFCFFLQICILTLSFAGWLFKCVCSCVGLGRFIFTFLFFLWKTKWGHMWLTYINMKLSIKCSTFFTSALIQSLKSNICLWDTKANDFLK